MSSPLSLNTDREQKALFFQMAAHSTLLNEYHCMPVERINIYSTLIHFRDLERVRFFDCNVQPCPRHLISWVSSLKFAQNEEKFPSKLYPQISGLTTVSNPPASIICVRLLPVGFFGWVFYFLICHSFSFHFSQKLAAELSFWQLKWPVRGKLEAYLSLFHEQI